MKEPTELPPVPTILDDGTPLADLQAAMQAAWLADNYELSADLAKRYGLYNKLCLRCAIPSMSILAYCRCSGDSPPSDTYLMHLCQPCLHEALDLLREHVKPVGFNSASAAVQALQQHLKIPADGIVGPITLAQVLSHSWRTKQP